MVWNLKLGQTLSAVLKQTFCAAALASLLTGGSELAHAVDLTPEAAAAKVMAETFMSGTTEWKGPETSPKPQQGKRIAVVSCFQSSEGAARPTRAMTEAGKAIGWTIDIFDGKGDPQEQNKAVNAAVDSKYDGIVLVFVDTPVVAEGVARAIEAKIPVITLGSMKNTPESIPDISHDYLKEGEVIGNYMIWKSNGDVNALLLKNTDLYVVTNGQFKGTADVLADPAKCKDCKTEVKEWALANIDSQPASISSASIQGDPSKNWVWCFDGCMARVSRNLIASGLGQNIKGAGFDCNGENLQLIKDEQIQAVSICDPRDWEAYSIIDNMNRLIQSEPVAQQEIPMLLVDKDNVGVLTEQEIMGGWQGGYDFRTKYLQLWGVK